MSEDDYPTAVSPDRRYHHRDNYSQKSSSSYSRVAAPTRSVHPPDSPSGFRVFCGPIVHSADDQLLKCYDRAAVCVKDDEIIAVAPNFVDLEKLQDKYGFPSDSVYELAPGEFLMPGMIDAHVHASQYPNIGIGMDLPMLQWLYTYTYPMEARFKDPKLCDDTYRKVVTKTLRCGTTTACYFTTIHKNSARTMTDIVSEFGQRGLIGKVSMDRNGPEYYVEYTGQAIEDTKETIEYILKKNNPLVTPMVCPKFALCCSKELMEGLAKLASSYDIPIATHISESKADVHDVGAIFSEYSGYVDVYDKCGLLTPSTMLAHGVHLEPSDISFLRIKNCGIVHCPSSNAILSGGLADAREMLSAQLKVGLGSDIAGGWSYSMMDVMRHAVQISRIVGMKKPQGYHTITHKEAFMLGTLGSARVLGLDDKLGNFEEGKQFDAVLVNTKAPHGPIDPMPNDSVEELVQRFIYIGDDRNVKDVYVAGNHVVSHA